MTRQPAHIRLRPTVAGDLSYFFEFQKDEAAGRMAAFTPGDRFDQSAWLDRHSRYLADPTINNQTILVNDRIVGSIAKFMVEGDAELTYWLDRSCWGQGIGSKALKAFLDLESTRPIYGRVAFDNIASQKILERAGFVKTGSDKGFAPARDTIIEEYIFLLR
ncbi:GNAT family N-acetyltransferase [Niabella terrae]